ncbi:FixH family protein [Pseudoalteromonas sp. BDTF-M6]|uniref:FixH family protein n=1 Tax=Pseudoalteromonas sp. BDTF-M6 TaxID=2796132 RepID=UPI001BAF9F0D|nr:FixH family protein [Pseudoalteromonas sp. BDTF-M6]MBS3796907.1 FixH family protein [Pseudoalteromonas sp. BDTF-M6]
MNATPWYKQFWPWFLLFFPLATIIACVGLITLAVGNGPDMVVDDYYKKGKAINLELTKFDKAKALYLHGDLQITDERISFAFTKGDDSKVAALNIGLYHRTISDKDLTFRLTKNARGQFTTLLDTPVEQGAYTVFITPFDDTWKLKENIQLPQAGAIKVSPEYK